MPLSTAMELTMRCRGQNDEYSMQRTEREVERGSGTDGTQRGTRNTEDEQLERSWTVDGGWWMVDGGRWTTDDG